MEKKEEKPTKSSSRGNEGKWTPGGPEIKNDPFFRIERTARNTVALADLYRTGISGAETRTAGVTDLVTGNARAVAAPRMSCTLVTRLMRIAVDERSTSR